MVIFNRFMLKIYEAIQRTIIIIYVFKLIEISVQPYNMRIKNNYRFRH
jgi:hypothetical protein